MVKFFMDIYSTYQHVKRKLQTHIMTPKHIKPNSIKLKLVLMQYTLK